MKQYLLGSLLVISINSALGMERAVSFEETEELISLQKLPTQQPLVLENLFILEYLFQKLPTGQAIDCIKKWSATNKKFRRVLKDPILARYLIKRLYKLSYRGKCEMQLSSKSVIQGNGGRLASLCNDYEFTLFKNSKTEGDTLVGLLKDKQWDKVLSKLHDLKKEPFAYYLTNYYWDGSTYFSSPARMTLLIYALELSAPKKVIDSLLNYGCPLTSLDIHTPPPCVVVCKDICYINSFCNQLISCNDRISAHTNKSTVSKSELEEQRNARLKPFYALLGELFKAGASLDDYFFACRSKIKITPLSIALTVDNPELLNYLLTFLAKDSDALECAFDQVMESSEKTIPSSATIETLIAAAHNLHPFLYRLLCCALKEGDEKRKDQYIDLLPLFLTDRIDINRLYGGVTLLDTVYQYEGNDKIANLLIKKGATENPNPSERHTKMTALCRKYTTTVNNMKTGTSEDYKRSIIDLLQTLQAELSSPELTDEDRLHLIGFGLHCAIEIMSSQEAKEFFKWAGCFKKQFDLPLSSETTASVFLYLVAFYISKPALHCSTLYKKHAQDLEKTIYDLISWLAQEGVEDLYDKEGKSAAQVADDFTMPDLANHIRKALARTDKETITSLATTS